MVSSHKIAIIGVPQDLGASRRGVDSGPFAIRVAGLNDKLRKLGYDVRDFGNLQCHDIDEHTELVDDNQKLRYIEHIIETCNKLRDLTSSVIEQGYFPLIIGGDHSITIGTLAGIKRKFQSKTGLLWIDAHGDFNTPSTTPSGNIHGMGFAVSTGRGDDRLINIAGGSSISEKNCVLIAARDLDPGEANLLKESQVTVFTMKDIDEIGMVEVAKKALKIASDGVDSLHCSFDIDALDPNEAPGTGTTVAGGLTYREAHLLMEHIHESGKLTSFEMVEVNPILDIRNKTAELAVGLVTSALGKKILKGNLT